MTGMLIIVWWSIKIYLDIFVSISKSSSALRIWWKLHEFTLLLTLWGVCSRSAKVEKLTKNVDPQAKRAWRQALVSLDLILLESRQCYKMVYNIIWTGEWKGQINMECGFMKKLATPTWPFRWINERISDYSYLISQLNWLINVFSSAQKINIHHALTSLNKGIANKF